MALPFFNEARRIKAAYNKEPNVSTTPRHVDHHGEHRDDHHHCHFENFRGRVVSFRVCVQSLIKHDNRDQYHNRTISFRLPNAYLSRVSVGFPLLPRQHRWSSDYQHRPVEERFELLLPVRVFLCFSVFGPEL